MWLQTCSVQGLKLETCRRLTCLFSIFQTSAPRVLRGLLGLKPGHGCADRGPPPTGAPGISLDMR
jgi:hypothetical protein